MSGDDTLSEEEIKKLYSDPEFFISYMKKMNKEKPFIPSQFSSSSSTIENYPDSFPPKPSYYSPPYDLKPVDHFPCNNFKNINDILYSTNPEAEAKRIKVVEIYKEKKMKYLKEFHDNNIIM